MTSETEFVEQRQSAAMLAPLAPLLRRAMPWLARWSKYGPEAAVPSSIDNPAAGPAARRENAASADCRRDSLPWWVVHHPALSFRGQESDERRD